MDPKPVDQSVFSRSLVIIMVSLIGGWFGYELSKLRVGRSLLSIKMFGIVGFLGSIWNMPYLSTYGLSYTPLIFGYSTLKSFDGGWNEYFGGQGLYILFIGISKINQWWQFNNLKIFLLFFVMWIIVIIFMIF